MAEHGEKKLGTVSMTALVIGAIVGSGIFSLPQNMAEGAGPGAIIIAWIITFVGMLTLTRIFQWLATNRSDITDGIYGYARVGFGEYLGFNAAWGYWISSWVTLVGYLVLIFSALGAYGPLSFFGEGSTLPSLICSLVILWTLHIFILKGVRSASILNVVVTIAKMVPIVLFIICVAFAFKIETFKIDFWGNDSLGNLSEQVQNTMLYTVWVFLGIECATVFGNRAKSMKIVSRATLFGFLITIALLICVSLLSLGIVPQAELAGMRNPSMAGVLAYVLGPWGAVLISIGMIISVGGALLAWCMISYEILFLAAKGDNHTVPSMFAKRNDHGMPTNVMILTNILVSLFLIMNHFSDAGYNLLIQLSSSLALIPYLLCAGFALKLAMKQESKDIKLLALTSLGTFYGIWLIYAGGLDFLMMSLTLYALGTPLYLMARSERSRKWQTADQLKAA